MPHPTLRTALAVVASASLLTTGCASVPPEGSAVTQGEQAIGAEAHPQILAEFGGVYTGDPQTTALVQRIGREMAVQSGLAQTGSECTVTVLNTNVTNAFAIPGCYIYVTRGLLSIMNNEAELASVLGHEIGHVAARHGQRRQNRAQTGGLLTVLGSVLAGVLTGSGDLANAVGQVGGQAAQLWTLSYSRDQEFEADALGVRYMNEAGYSPYAAADMLESLGDEEALQALVRGRNEAARIPDWARSHPLTGDRVERATALARETGRQPGTGQLNRDAYLAAIDDMLYGDDPEQGYVEGSTFQHPQLRLYFRAPEGFYLQNSTRAVTAVGPNGLQAQFGGGALQGGEGLTGYVERVARGLVGQAQVQVGQLRETTVNGLPTAVLPLRAGTQSGPVDILIAAYRWSDDQAYHFIAIAPGGASTAPLEQLIGSVRRLSAQEAAELRPRVLDIVTVQRGDTVQSLAQRMAYSNYRVERFRMLNDLDQDDTLQSGQRVKIVRYASR